MWSAITSSLRIASLLCIVTAGAAAADPWRGGPAISPYDCDRNWEAIGYADGRRAAPPFNTAPLRAACAQIGLGDLVDFYVLGYVEGVESRCQARFGRPLAFGGVCFQAEQLSRTRAYANARRLKGRANW